MPERSNPLLEQVRESVAGTYDLLGELGVDEHAIMLYLAREATTGLLVGLSVTQSDTDGAEYAVEVRRTLGESVAVEGSVCPECNTTLPDLERFCFQCGADLSGVVAADGTPESSRVLAALAAATAGRFEILGRMDRDGKTGTVYFARELTANTIVALRLRRANASDGVEAEYVVRQTQIFRAQGSPTLTPGKSAMAAAVIAASATIAANASSTPVASTSTRGSAYDAVFEAHGEPRSRPVWLRTPVIAGVAVVLLGSVGYFALRDSGDAATPTAGAAATPSGPTTPSLVTPPIPETPAPPTPTPVVAVVDSGTIRLVSLPAGTRVTVDGTILQGRTARVKAGMHVLSVSVAGATAVTERIRVSAGATVPWTLKAPLPTVAANLATPAITPATATPSRNEPKVKTSACRAAIKKEDWAAAMIPCTTEANEGDIVAAASVARLYARGLGTRTDANAAFGWYTKAAAGGDHEAQTQLGYAFRDGAGTKRDASQAVKWFKQAAESGDASAQLEYAVALEKGSGLNRDEVNAREWYKKAADKGSYMAARRLGHMFEHGDGGARSDADAAIAYERAATMGDVESAMIMGKWYRDGRGVAKSPAQALVWFKKAAELGSTDAKKEIQRLEKGA